MLGFTSQETRERHQYAEDIMGSGYTVLDSLAEQDIAFDHPSLVQKYGDLAVALSDVIDRMYVPNMSSFGNVIVPKQYRDADAVAVLPFGPNKPVGLSKDFHTTTPEQTNCLARQIAARDEICVAGAHLLIQALQQRQNYFTRLVSYTEFTLDNASGGKAGFACVPNKVVGASYIWAQRPLIMLNQTIGSHANGVTLLHEAMHYLQFERFPLHTEPRDIKHIRDELEAQYVSGVVGKGTDSDPSHDTHTVINTLRESYNATREDPFYPYMDLQMGLDASGVGKHAGIDPRVTFEKRWMT